MTNLVSEILIIGILITIVIWHGRIETRSRKLITMILLVAELITRLSSIIWIVFTEIKLALCQEWGMEIAWSAHRYRNRGNYHVERGDIDLAAVAAAATSRPFWRCLRCGTMLSTLETY